MILGVANFSIVMVMYEGSIILVFFNFLRILACKEKRAEKSLDSKN